MSLVMDNVPLGQSHYVTCYGRQASGKVIMTLVKTKCHWDRVIMTLVTDKVPLGQSHYDTCYGQ